MPSINKSQPTKPKKPTRNESATPWGRIESVRSRPSKGIKINTYGRGKTGKTRFACSFPKPLLLIGSEDGTETVKDRPGIDFLRVSCCDDLGQLVEGMKEGQGSRWKFTKGQWNEVDIGEGDPYVSSALDTAGGFQNYVIREELGLEEIPVQKGWGMATQQQWGAITAQTCDWLRKYLDLADNNLINIIIIAHERNFSSDNGEGSDLIMPYVGSALTPGAAAWLNGACDYICQTYIREQTTEKNLGTKEKPVKQTLPTGKREYCLRIGPHPIYNTGFRHVDGIVLPDTIINPTYDKIKKLIDGKSIEETKK